MSKTEKIILRILISPFLFCIILIRYVLASFKHTGLAIRYGGEWINYSKDHEQKTIGDIYKEIKHQRKP